VEASLVIRNQLGLHIRAASKFVQLASKFQSHVLVSSGDLEVNGKSIMGVIMLAAEEGAVIQVRAEGEDEREAVKALEDLVADRFGEPS
jgi:phosphocarrier protein